MGKTPAQIQAEIATLFADNHSGAITPVALRTVTNDLTAMLDNVPNVDATNASNLSSGTVPAARIAATGPPLVALFEGQSYLTTNQAFAWTPPPNLLLWNFDGVDGHVGTAFAAPSGTTINTAISRAAQIARENPTRTVYAVIVGFSGLAISHWLTGTGGIDAYANAVANIVPALAAAGAPTIERFGWLQGNGDCGPLNASYVANHATMMARNYGNSWFPRETKIDVFSICSTADSLGTNTDADHMNCLLEAVAAADPDKRRYIYMSSLTGATYWDAGNAGHPTGQGAFSIGQLQGRPVMPQVNVDPASGYIVNGNVGFSAAPVALNLNAVGATLPATSARVQIAGPDGGDVFPLLDAWGGFTQFVGRRANGTFSAKTTLAANDIITGLAGQGYDGAAYSASAAAINMCASETWTAAHHGTYTPFFNTITGTLTAVEYMRGTGTGLTIMPNTATPAGGSTGAFLAFGTTAGFGIYFGSGAPSIAAGKGSFYLRSDATTNTSRAYINTDGGTTWTALNTVA